MTDIDDNQTPVEDALELADALDAFNENILGPTDSELCVKALRAYAGLLKLAEAA